MNLGLAVLSAILFAAIVRACLVQNLRWRLATIGMSTVMFVAFAIALILAMRSTPPVGRPDDDPPVVTRPEHIVAPAAVTVATSILDQHTPHQVSADGYVSSASCRDCHQAQHDTWHASYHRTMTQRATPAAVFGDFNDVQIKDKGISYRLQRRGDQYWCRMAMDDQTEGPSPEIDLPLVLTTGSHHMQVYWFPIRSGRTLAQLPLVYLKEEEKWVPMESSFLTPPTHAKPPPATGRWNNECIQCHTTHGRTRLVAGDDSRTDSEVGQFGIACEACHGPAEQHVRFHRAEENNSSNPSAAEAILNPATLTHERSTEVCGRCHGITLPRRQSDFADLFANGYRFRPGDRLADTLHLLGRDAATRVRLRDGIAGSEEEVDRALDLQFWSDGMVRVSGREFNGLSNSRCYQQGDMSCLTCHQLHKSEDDPRPLETWANDQLKTSGIGDDACLRCHQSGGYDTPVHTHHMPESQGSRCYNCHMPHTTYGLLKAIRSHTIDRPSAANSLATGRPNACNLCHLDKSLAWTATHLTDWYSLETPEMDETVTRLSAAVLWALRGDAGQRALVAWHMGWEPALEASGGEWMPPFLATVLDDPYDAVRYIANRSLHRSPHFRDFAYDFVGSPESRQTAVERAMQHWNATKSWGGSAPRDALLIDAVGDLRQEAVLDLKRQRDDRPVDLAE